MITTNAEIKIKKKVSESLFLISVTLERYKQWIPGMFLQISIDEKTASEPWLDGRAFSFANWGSEKALILVRKEGAFTTSLIAKAMNGFITSVRYPFGDFLLDSNSNKVFIAGGAGISVFLSYLDYIKVNNILRKILLVHSAKRSFETVKNIYDSVIPTNVLLKQFITYKRDPKYTGRPTFDVLTTLDTGFDKFEYYVCGPQKFNSFWQEELRSVGIIPKVEQWENWVTGK